VRNIAAVGASTSVKAVGEKTPVRQIRAIRDIRGFKKTTDVTDSTDTMQARRERAACDARQRFFGVVGPTRNRD